MRRTDRELAEIEQIEEIIGKADVCRVAFANNNLPYIVTLNFGYLSKPGRSFYFHCARQGKKLDMMGLNKYVCFELDTDHKLVAGPDACDWGMNYSSVVGYGNLCEVIDPDERVSGMNAIMKHNGGEGIYTYKENVFRQTTILRLDVLEMSGKKK
jgi:uncharacterized protein